MTFYLLFNFVNQQAFASKIPLQCCNIFSDYTKRKFKNTVRRAMPPVPIVFYHIQSIFSSITPRLHPAEQEVVNSAGPTGKWASGVGVEPTTPRTGDARKLLHQCLTHTFPETIPALRLLYR